MLHPKLFFSALVVAGLAVLGVAAAQDLNNLLGEFAWRPIGPTNMGGRIDDVEAVESDPAVIYVGAASSGLWKTENNGTTWKAVFDAQPNLSIGDIAIAPSNPNIVWVGTGESNQRQSTTYGGGMFKSVDAGKTWSAMGLPESGTVGRILIDPKSPDVVYVAIARRPVQGWSRTRAVQNDRRRPYVDEIQVHRRGHRVHRRGHGPVEQPDAHRCVVSTPANGLGIQRRRSGQRSLEDD
jgi:hypothetical protein